jgi:hypothetical protein
MWQQLIHGGLQLAPVVAEGLQLPQAPVAMCRFHLQQQQQQQQQQRQQQQQQQQR